MRITQIYYYIHTSLPWTISLNLSANKNNTPPYRQKWKKDTPGRCHGPLTLQREDIHMYDN